MIVRQLYSTLAGTVLVAALLLAGPRVGAMETAAKQAFIVDFQTGAVLLEKNADEPIHPASMSKLMTLYLLFERLKEGRISLDDTFPVSEKAWALNEGSTMFVGIDTQIRVEDLIRGIIVQSGNDACIVVAEGLAGSEEAFAELMNERAREMGLTGSHFVNSHGLEDPNHKMTARDLATLAKRLIVDFPEYYHYFAEKEFVFNGIKQGNRNPLLYRNIGADGLKTGHLSVSGYGIAASAERDGRRIILVAHGMDGMQSRADEATNLIEWAFREFDNYRLVKAGDVLEEAPVWYGQAETVPLTVAGDLLVTLPRNARDRLRAKAVFDGPIPAPIAAGQEIGKLVISAPDVPDTEVPLVAGVAVERLGAFGRIMAAVTHLLGGGA
ncbi:MAG TPA: D-alanyl-D-alanine carboxypeptidase family protein [Dongiaceae bacterium]|nr:D-alanyl-D-alanine carboxypeptidase family protein [Dongiaceae bacterium]